MKTLQQKLDINSKHYLTVMQHIKKGGGTSRLVGGVVRDALLGNNNADIDITTDLLPEEVTKLLKERGIKVIPTGIKFGTVTAIIENEIFEITTLRSDISTDGRHAKVKYSKDFAEDAARRDFTINALSYCPFEHKIYDYFTGIEDLETKKVIFIGDATARIKEDYLRILRFLRFSCRYAKSLDKKGLDACRANLGGIKRLSLERIKAEMDGLLSCRNAPGILTVAFENKILQSMYPLENYNEEMHKKALKQMHNLGQGLDLIVLYALIFHGANIDINRKTLLELKFSRYEADKISALLSIDKITDKLILKDRLLQFWFEEKNYLRYFIYAGVMGQNDEVIWGLHKKLSKVNPEDFPVVGDDILALGVRGPDVGKALKSLRYEWVNSDFKLGKTELIKLVKKHEK